MKHTTILGATKQWVGEFNAINQSVISRLMTHEMDNWGELTKVSVGDYVSVYGEVTNLETFETEQVSGSYEVVSTFYVEENGTLRIEVDGVECSVDQNEVDVERDSYLPMWGTMWTFGSLDEDWIRENLQAVTDCGFRIYEDYETGDIYVGIDGAGYDFYEQHWIPLYKKRGLQWHTLNDEDVLKAILVDLVEDEREACFDTSYCCDESWKEQHGDKTRQEGFDESMAWHKSLTLDELLEHYGDRYDYILDRLGYKKK